GAATPMAFSGERAFGDLKRLVEFGPRPPGSKALAESRQWIIGQLKQAGCETQEDRFVAETPVGSIPMTNVIAKIPGTRPEVLMDMIADANLDIHRDPNSTPWLSDLVFHAARRLGYSRYFLDSPMAVEDDHIPFVNAGVSAADIIDLDYGPPGNSYHHTIKDTVDKCSAASMTVVGRAVTAALEQLEQSLPAKP